MISAIQADEPVVEARLAVKGSGVGLGPMIPPGMRAVSVRVNDVVGVAGFVLPGMRVDVLVTGKPPIAPDTETQTVLQNITVLSAGQTIQTDGKSQPIVAPVVTLLVNPARGGGADPGQCRRPHSTGAAQFHRPGGGRPRAAAGCTSCTARRRCEAPPERPAEAAPRPVARRERQTARAPCRGPDAGWQAAGRPVVPVPEAEQMIMIRGAVKNVEVFSKEQETK